MHCTLRSFALAVLAALTLGSAPPTRAATGALDAVGPDGTPRGGCPLEHTDVHVDVAGFVARVTVTQRFRNPFPDPIEAVYTFPLSERAAVDAMRVRTGDRTIEGRIERREDAKAIYDAARAAGQLAARLDEERPNVFTQSVANLLPGATVEVHVEYTEALRFTAGTFELVFPTVVGPRFSPPGTPDADRVTPPVTPEGTRAGHDIAIGVDVDAGVPVSEVVAPLHAVDVERPAPSQVRVRLREQREYPNRDFVLRWTVSTDAVQSGYLTHRSGAGDGYVSIVLLPPRRVTSTTAAPKELVFVIDRSGSQMGAPLEKAKETMRWIFDHLNPNDTFQVVDFGSTSNVLFPAPQPVTAATRARARAHIDALEANGGTMMAEAVERVCAMPADDNRLRIVTFMTDGYVGNDLEVLGLVRGLRARSRWFPFGTGNGVNRFLIDAMARVGGGEPAYVLLNRAGDEVARDFYDRIASPVLTDVRVAWEGLDVVDVHPGELADVWAERPLVIHARYRTPGSGRVVLTGFQAGEPYRQELAVTLPARSDDHAAVASMWARAKVEALTTQDLGALQSGAFPPALKEQVVTVALAHRLVTPFTSFVAVEDRVITDGGTTKTVRVPVEMPDGVRYEGVFGAADAASGGAMRAAPLQAAKRALAAAPPPPATEPKVAGEASRRDEEDRARQEAPGGRARRRLDAALLTLLAQGPGAAGAVRADGGWVRVRVVLRDTAAATLRALQAAGFVLETVGEGDVVGAVAVTDLVRLAEAPGVRRVESQPS